MTKSELIKMLTSILGKVPANKINMSVDKIFEELASALVLDKRIELRGFGSFSLRKRKSRLARNPKNNEVISVNDRAVVYFRSGKELNEQLN